MPCDVALAAHAQGRHDVTYDSSIKFFNYKFGTKGSILYRNIKAYNEI